MAAMSRLEREITFKQLSSDPVASDEAQRSEAAFQEQQFLDKFNKLVRALTDFSKAYNGEGTIDAKKVRAVKKAWRDLEKSDPWFADKK